MKKTFPKLKKKKEEEVIFYLDSKHGHCSVSSPTLQH
jgi:hypothetical protein